MIESRADMGPPPLVSVIIIFFNEERFLEEAIESVFGQSFSDWELLLCDDGSTDRSTEIAATYAERYPDNVRYLEHAGHVNLGMSATRNLGLRHARGELVAWLDGDDIWTPEKLERQVGLLEAHPETAMVYGRLHVWYGWTGIEADAQRDFIQDLGGSANTLIEPPELLERFLQDDLYTPSGVLVRRSVLEEIGGYEESFRDMHEDGIVHAKICLKWPVYASGESWYKYRQHPNSRCNESIAAGTDRAALEAFLTWLEGYLEEQKLEGSNVLQIVRRLNRANRTTRVGAWSTQAKGMLRASLRRGRGVADRTVPRFIRSWIGLLAFRGQFRPPSGWLHLGNLRRVTPISRTFGFDRGMPVDRYYIEQFLQAHASDIRGHVLEVGDRSYTTRFGGDRVSRSDVLHARHGNPEATLVGDLCTGEGIPEEAFDCIILTQVLPFLWDFKAAIDMLERALKPNGVLLATVPGISQISRFDADQWGDYWRFTSISARRLFEERFKPEQMSVNVYGNVLAATAFLHGVAAQELRADELDYLDPDYEVTVTVRAQKTSRAGSESP